ncbi:hypothetical protein A6A19_01385 [Actinobacillus delphinicola]|uniref:PoNe immunity protein domain-containing protein n=1 Tax=Actinobacillus delphinicola TaxID=51161 RepID=UPI0024416792|nr:PoNe immunity protein domain-containing protein [Actinobacillus delphinicola]MDG6896681.1 hypothetical protein [Actinobacillus delphinicola]
MRDTIQDEKFFENRINDTEDFISKWKTYLSEEKEKKHEHGIKTCLSVLSIAYSRIFRQYYSIGKDPDELYPYYKEWLNYYSKSIEKDEYMSLAELLDLFFIGVCYEDKKEEFLPYLQSIVDNAQPYIDPTLELYIKYLGLKPNEGKRAKFKKNYLERLLNSEDKVKALKNTMANWYRFNKGNLGMDVMREKIMMATGHLMYVG